MAVRGYRLTVDWSGDNSHDGPHEDVTSRVRPDPVLEVTYGRDSSATAGQIPTGSMGFALNNLDRVLSPQNAASPLAGKVRPGRRVQLTFTHPTTGQIINLWAGITDRVFTEPNTAGLPLSVECLDAWGRPGAESLSTPLYRGLRTGDAINVVLDAAGWTGGRDIDPGATVMPWWWAEDVDAGTAIERIVDSEGPPAIAYVQAGTFVFRDRHHRLIRDRSLTSQGMYTHIQPAGTGPAGDYKILRGAIYDDGLSNIVNSCTINVEERIPADRAEVWVSEEPTPIGAGGTVTIFAQADDPFMDATVVVDAVGGPVTVALSRTSGRSTILTLTAPSDALVNRLSVVATPVTVARTVKIVEEDVSSIDEFGQQTWQGEPVWASASDAQAIARRVVSTYATARPIITVSIAYAPGMPSRYLDQVMTRQVSDRIWLRIDPLGVNGPFLIERVHHEIIRLGAIHRLTLTCEVPDPVQPATVFTFDVAGRGFDQGGFGLSGIDNPATMLRFDVAGQGFDQGFFAS
ncbi:hypothetical protein ACIBCR_15140 [Micromonospora echinospora]|uniref:hypothetical protein n=1 Tax=Micromonospora echinospora TaxID=1877 RepID=UPI0037ADF98D